MQVVAPRFVPFLPLRALIAFPQGLSDLYGPRDVDKSGRSGRRPEDPDSAGGSERRDGRDRTRWAIRMDGTASLANREIGPVLPGNYWKVPGSVWVCRFSGKEYEHGCWPKTSRCLIGNTARGIIEISAVLC
jgi:hypothetical protein